MLLLIHTLFPWSTNIRVLNYLFRKQPNHNQKDLKKALLLGICVLSVF